LKYVKGFVAVYFYYILLIAFFYFRHFGTNEITYALILHSLLGIPLVLLGALIIELINQTNVLKKSMVLFTGFIYGISYSIIFGGGVDLDYYILASTGLLSSLGFFIYLYFRGKSLQIR
jgi:hypothetical protein